MLRLTFPRAKLRRQIFMTRAEVWAKNWAKNWAKFSEHFRASFAVQNDPQIFSQNPSQFITPCLVAEILKFHLRELLGFGGRQNMRRTAQVFVTQVRESFCESGECVRHSQTKGLTSGKSPVQLPKKAGKSSGEVFQGFLPRQPWIAVPFSEVPPVLPGIS